VLEKCVLYVHEFVVSEKVASIFPVAITAHHPPPIKYVMILHALTLKSLN
jgi:hypothetical protein